MFFSSTQESGSHFSASVYNSLLTKDTTLGNRNAIDVRRFTLEESMVLSKQTGFALLGSLFAIALATPAGATPLPLAPGACYGASSIGLCPGGGPTNLSIHPPSQNSPINPSQILATTGVLSVTGLNPQTNALAFTGNFEEIVYRNSNGFLSFYYQIGITGPTSTSHTNWLQTSGFAGFATSAWYNTNTSVLPGFPTQTNPQTYQAPNGVMRSNNGSTVTFMFAPPNTPFQFMNTYAMVIDTNATSFTFGNTQMINSGTAFIANTFAPSPEPGAIILFGTVLIMGGFFARKRLSRN